jgi:ABC-type uncharacterized transport system ATPase subunit
LGGQLGAVSAAEQRTGAHPLVDLPGVQLLDGSLGRWRYELFPGTDSDALLRYLLERTQAEHFSVDYPGLEDIYLTQVSQDAHDVEVCGTSKGA